MTFWSKRCWNLEKKIGGGGCLHEKISIFLLKFATI